MSTKRQIFWGTSLALCFGGLYVYYQYNKEPEHIKLYKSLRKIQQGVYQYLLQLPDEEVVKDMKQLNFKTAKQLGALRQTIVNTEKLALLFKRDEEMFKVPQINLQDKIFKLDIVERYHETKKLSSINKQLNEIGAQYQLSRSGQINYGQQIKLFYHTAFIILIHALEEYLLQNQSALRELSIQIYVYAILIVVADLLQDIPQAAQLLAEVLLSPTDLYFTNHVYGHNCEDNKNMCDKQYQNKKCKCLIIDLLTRYWSLLFQDNQRNIVNYLIKFQIFQTEEQILLLTKILFKNSYFIELQRTSKQMKDKDRFHSSINKLLVALIGNSRIQVKLVNEHYASFINYFDYIRIHISKNLTEYTAHFVEEMIYHHCILFQLFDNPQNINTLCQLPIIKHFFEILTIVEVNGVVQPEDVQKNQYLIDNMSTILLHDLISNLQIQFIKILIKYQFTHKHIGQVLVKYLITTMNIRINQNEYLTINATLTKAIGYVMLGMSNSYMITKSMLKKSLTYLPFKDEREIVIIFTNTIEFLYSVITMNVTLLNIIILPSIQTCPESVSYFNFLNQHMFSCRTLNYDTYMMTLQLSLMFGDIEIIVRDIKKINQRNQFGLSEDQIMVKDLMLLIDILENPYYALNILRQQEKIDDNQELVLHLQQQAVIAILQINQSLATSDLLSELQQYIDIETIPEHINQMLIIKENDLIELKQEFIKSYPYKAIQRHPAMLQTYLRKCPDKYQELLQDQKTFPYLEKLRSRLFKNEQFIGYFLTFFSCTQKEASQVWLTKFLFYTKQFLLAGNQIAHVQKLFQQECVQLFIEDLSKEPNTEAIVQYLRS